MKTHYKSALMVILEVFGTLSHVDCQSVFRNDAFYRVVERSFSQSVISEIHQLWPSSSFSKCLKFDVDSGNRTKNWESVFRSSDNSIWIGRGKFSQCSIGYLPSAVNLLRSIPKISPNSTVDIFQINFCQNDEKTWRKGSHGDFTSIWDTFTCWLSKCFPKRRFL